MRLFFLARTWDLLVGRKTRRSPFVGLNALPLEDRITPTGRPLPLPYIFVGAGSGAPPLVRAYDAETGALKFERQPFASGFAGGVRVGTGDIDHDGIPDLIAAAGPGGGPRVVIYSGKTGNQLSGPLGSFYAYDPTFTGGVYATAGDVDGDGYHDLITAAGAGGTPHVKVYSGYSGALIASFHAFDTGFRGGATVMAADFTGDGKAELVVGAGAGGGPNVRVFDLNTGNPLPPPLGSFFAFDESFAGGVEVGTDVLTGDVTGDGHADIVAGRGAGAGSLVRVFDGKTGAQVREFSPFGAGMTAGVRVATAFIDDDRYADIVAATGAGVSAQVKVFSGLTGVELASPMSPYSPFGSSFTGGLFVAASNDPEVPGITAKLSTPTVAQGGSVTITVDVADIDSSNGVQTPTGEVWVSIIGLSWPDNHADLVAVSPGLARATFVYDPVTADAGSQGLYYAYNGDDNFLPTIGDPLTLTVTDPTATGHLDVIDSNGNAVAKNQAGWKPGWVPLNNDNYNFDGDQATSLKQLLDKDEAGKVDGENDLVKIRVSNLDNAHSYFVRFTGLPFIKVWRSADKVGEVVNGTEVSAETDLWVEGVYGSYSAFDVSLQLVYGKRGWPSWYAQTAADTAKFTVYEVKGAMDVPGYSKYRYTAYTPGGAPRFEAGAQVVNLTQDDPGPGPVVLPTRSADILWEAGATVGVYRVYPTTANNFFIDRQVNVVKIEISTPAQPAGTNQVAFNNPPIQVAYGQKTIWSSIQPNPPAMSAYLHVTKIEGPLVGGSMRGVRFIEVGFIQNVNNTELHADYDGFVPTRQRRLNTSEGKSFLDADEGPVPWYETQVIDQKIAVYAPGTDQGVPIQGIDLYMDDTPSLPATDKMDLSIPDGKGGLVWDYVDSFALKIDFDLFFAVRTFEAVLGSQSVYTQRGSTPWTFNGSGTIDDGTIIPANRGKWSKADVAGTNSKGANPVSFAVVTNGSVVPITVGPVGNTVLNDPNVIHWVTVDKPP